MYDHVSGFVQQLRFGGNGDAPRRVRSAHNLAKIAAGFGGIDIDRADQLESLLFPHETHEGCADGTNAILNDTNLFLQFDLLAGPLTGM